MGVKVYRVTTSCLSAKAGAQGFHIYATEKVDLQNYEEAVALYDDKRKTLTTKDLVVLEFIDILAEGNGSQELQAP
jgi:hypothetical protein